MKFDTNKYRPCKAWIRWYQLQPGIRGAWNKCHRGDWMIWLAAMFGVDQDLICDAATKCLELGRGINKSPVVWNIFDKIKDRVFDDVSDAELVDILFRNAIREAEVCQSEIALSLQYLFTLLNNAFLPKRDIANYAYAILSYTCSAIGNKAVYPNAYCATQAKMASVCRTMLTNAVLKKLEEMDA